MKLKQKQKRKKLIVFSAAVLMIICLLPVYYFAEEPTPEPLKIVTTIFPIYDWVLNILGDTPVNAEVTMLVDNGVDPHSYQPSVGDIMDIVDCDLFIYVGGESDSWAGEALQNAENQQMLIINLLELLGDAAREEEFVEGMQGADEHEEAGEDTEDGESEYDEHVWLSLRNAQTLVNGITTALVYADPEHAENYMDNEAAYLDRLQELDEQYQAVVEAAPVHTLVFGDRFPFRYLIEDYGLQYYAAFAGCSAETEASFDTIIFLAQKIDELSLHAVMTIEGADHRIAETIIQTTASRDQQILELNSMQATTLQEAQQGAGYYSIMEENLEVLKEALQ